MSSATDTTKSNRESTLSLSEPHKVLEGIELHLLETSEDRTRVAKRARDRSHVELSQWEFAALALVDHPLALDPKEIAHDDKDHPVFVYEGPRFQATDGSLEPSIDPKRLAEDLLSLLAALHEAGLVRLGLSVSSFWLVDDGTGVRPMLASLRPGPTLPASVYRPNALGPDRPRLKQPAAALAPEILLGEETDARTDLYSVGAILYELLTGVPPVDADDAWTALQDRIFRPPTSIAESRPDLPEEVAAVITQLLSFAPGERYPSAYAALSALGVADETRAFSPSPATILCPDLAGRSEALKELVATFEASTSGPTRVVSLLGDDGAGKHRLVEEFLARLKLRGVATFQGSYPMDERGLYFVPFGELASSLYSGNRRPPEEMESVLSQLFSDLAPSRGRSRGRRGSTPPRREQIQQVLGRLVLGLSPEGGPVCLVLEHVHGADPDHIGLLTALRQQLSDQPVLILTTLKPHTELPHDDFPHRIELDHLQAEDRARLAVSALGMDEVVPPPAVEGSPLAALETLKLGRRLVAEAEPSKDPVPSSPDDVIAERLQGLDGPDLAVLQALAVLGVPSERSQLAKLDEVEEDDLWSRLVQLQTRDYLRVRLSGNRVALELPHRLYRRVLLTTADPERRAALHARAVSLFEGRLKRGHSDLLWDVAYHAARADKDDKHTKYAAAAADRAADLFAVEASLQFFRRAVQAGLNDEKLNRVSMKLEGLLGLLDRESELRNIYEATPQVPAKFDGDPSTLLSQGHEALQATDFRHAIKQLSLAIELFRQSDDLGKAAEAACEMATLQRRLGAYDRSREFLEKAIQWATPDSRAAALSRIDLGRVLRLTGQPEASLLSYDEAIAIAGEGRDTGLEGLARAGKGQALLGLGRVDEARTFLEESLTALAPKNSTTANAWIELALAALDDAGRNDEAALEHYRNAQLAGNPRARLRGMVGAARSLTRLDRLGEAEETIQTALQVAQLPGALDLAWQAHSEAGRALRMAGRLDEALHAYLRAVTAIESLLDHAPIPKGDRGRFLKHDDRLKAFRSLLAVRLLIDRSPSLIEFAADDYLIAIIDRFQEDRYRQKKKTSERLEKMVEWLLRNREQIRVRPGAAAPLTTVVAERTPPDRVPKEHRYEGKNLLRMTAVLLSLDTTEDLIFHLLDMALDILDAEEGLLALLSGSDLKCAAGRELKGRDIDDAVRRLDALRSRRDLDDAEPVYQSRGDAGGRVLLALTRGDTLKGGIIVNVAGPPSEEALAYLQGFAAVAQHALDVSREIAQFKADQGRLAKENRKLQQDLTRAQRSVASFDDMVAEPPAERPRRRKKKADAEAPSDDGGAPTSQADADDSSPRLSRRARRAQEKREIVDALTECDFDRDAAAEKLEITRSTLNTRLRRYNIRINRLRSQVEAEAEAKAKRKAQGESSADASPEDGTAGADDAAATRDSGGSKAKRGSSQKAEGDEPTGDAEEAPLQEVEALAEAEVEGPRAAEARMEDDSDSEEE